MNYDCYEMFFDMDWSGVQDEPSLRFCRVVECFPIVWVFFSLVFVFLLGVVSHGRRGV